MTTFELTFKPGVTTTVDVDESNVLFHAVHRKTEAIPDQVQVIEDALANPIDAKPLEALL